MLFTNGICHSGFGPPTGRKAVQGRRAFWVNYLGESENTEIENLPETCKRRKSRSYRRRSCKTYFFGKCAFSADIVVTRAPIFRYIMYSVLTCFCFFFFFTGYVWPRLAAIMRRSYTLILMASLSLITSTLFLRARK